jgi:two-component system, OmpR family, sensor kinase
MTRVPIRIRVAAVFAVSMAVVLAGTGWFLYARLDSHLRTALDRELRVRAEDVAALVRDPHASLAPPNGRLVEHGESYTQLLDTRGRVLDATSPLGRFPLLRGEELARAAQRPLFSNRGPIPGLDEPSRLLATPVSRGGAPAVLVVGATREDRAETLVHLRNELLIAGPVALALATLAGYLLAGLSLGPVEAMRRRAAAISAETPGERLPVPATRDELERLGETLNEMLARLEDALRRERDFVADAGHELRTPLALLRTELELALRHGDSAEELRGAIGRSAAEVDRIAQLAEDLLLLARSERGRLPLHVERLETSEVLARVADRFAWRAEDARRLLRISSPDGLVVSADRLRLEQALGNLVDNALRHGSGAITLSAVQADGSVELHVADEGHGIPGDFLDRAFDRFARADGARPSGGAGLGLSIAKAIAEAHGGKAAAANRDGAGLDVWLSLPGQ